MPAGRVAVTNPLGWEREDWVVLAGRTGQGAVWLVGDHGHTTLGQFGPDGLGFTARVPAFGSVSYRVAPHPPAPSPTRGEGETMLPSPQRGRGG